MVNLEQLKESGIIPPDSKIISEHKILSLSLQSRN